MKIDNIELNGFDTVLIKTRKNNDYITTIFEKFADNRWRRKDKPTDTLTHNEMVSKIKGFTYSQWHRVWVNGTYINIYPWE